MVTATEPEEPESYKPTAGEDGGSRCPPIRPAPGGTTPPRSPGSLRAWPRSATTGRSAQFIGRVPGPVGHRPSASRSPRPCPVTGQVSDLAEPGAAAAALLAAMREASAPPNEKTPRPHPRRALRRAAWRVYGTERYWYKHSGLVHNGVAWHIEVTVAETSSPGDVVYACNYAVSFDDPLGRVRLRTADVQAYGAASFLGQCDATPGAGNEHCRTAVVHVTCAAPVPTRQGQDPARRPRRGRRRLRQGVVAGG